MSNHLLVNNRINFNVIHHGLKNVLFNINNLTRTISVALKSTKFQLK